MQSGKTNHSVTRVSINIHLHDVREPDDLCAHILTTSMNPLADASVQNINMPTPEILVELHLEDFHSELICNFFLDRLAWSESIASHLRITLHKLEHKSLTLTPFTSFSRWNLNE